MQTIYAAGWMTGSAESLMSMKEYRRFHKKDHHKNPVLGIFAHLLSEGKNGEYQSVRRG